MDKIQFAPPEKPWNDDSPVNTNEQWDSPWFHSGAKWISQPSTARKTRPKPKGGGNPQKETPWFKSTLGSKNRTLHPTATSFLRISPLGLRAGGALEGLAGGLAAARPRWHLRTKLVLRKFENRRVSSGFLAEHSKICFSSIKRLKEHLKERSESRSTLAFEEKSLVVGFVSMFDRMVLNGYVK